MNVYKKNWLKFVLAIFACFLIRIIPFRPPNIEPILATQMPFSKAYGKFAGFLFAFASIIIFDLLTGTLGKWSLITSVTYGILGVAGAFYLKNRKPSPWNFAKFAIAGTIFFDAVTGLSIGPLFFNQPFSEAFFGQIPFTALHLLGNVSFALVLSPAIFHFVVENKKLETETLARFFSWKRI